MKTIKYLTMAFAALFLSATFTACGDDDDDTPKSEQTENNGNNNSENKDDQNENAGNTDKEKDVEYSDDRDYSKDTKEAVDLGLSVKWATCNVGASSPEEYGSYFAWGETKQKKRYFWETYKYDNGDDDNYFTKYCPDSDYGKVDNKTVLEPEDDAATANWGGAWRMPTLDEWKELLDKEKCTWTWQDDKNGYKVTSKTNDNSIFLPAAGERDGTKLYYAGSYGRYWTSSLLTGDPGNAYYMDFNSGHYGWYYDIRYYGHAVRPVCK